MNVRDEINKIIATNCYTEEDKPEDSVIMGEDFGKLAEDLVKFCNLHFVIKGEAEPLKCDCGETEDVKLIAICASCYNPHTGEW